MPSVWDMEENPVASTSTLLSDGPPPRPPVQPPVVSAQAAIVLAASWAAVIAGMAGVGTVGQGAMQEWVEGADSGSAHLAVLAGLGMLNALLMLASWIAGGVWLLGIRRVADAVHPQAHHRRAAFWAVAGWVVPVVSWWFPYQVVADCAATLGERMPRLLPAWWASWLVASTLGTAAAQMGGDLLSAQDVSEWVLGLQISAVLFGLAILPWVLVVRRVTTSAQDAARSGVTVGP